MNKLSNLFIDCSIYAVLNPALARLFERCLIYNVFFYMMQLAPPKGDEYQFG